MGGFVAAAGTENASAAHQQKMAIRLRDGERGTTPEE
jgi:hypothetical protein